MRAHPGVLTLFLGLLVGANSDCRAADSYLRLSGKELSLQTKKWMGKKIEVPLNCLHADVAEYRCVGGGVRITIHKVSNGDGREKVERECNTLADSVRLRCRFLVRFTYDGSRRTGGTGELTILDALHSEAELSSD